MDQGQGDLRLKENGQHCKRNAAGAASKMCGADFEPCWPVFRKYLGDIRPASTAMIAALIDPRMKIEIEVTAKKRSA